jgi:hypothetical protein
MAMKETNEIDERNDVKSLRWASDFLCLWRVCATARCRRARSCRGSALTCADRNRAVLPPLVREFFIFLLAAKSVRLPFERFWEDWEGRPETEAYFAWRKAAHACPRGARRGT